MSSWGRDLNEIETVVQQLAALMSVLCKEKEKEEQKQKKQVLRRKCLGQELERSFTFGMNQAPRSHVVGLGVELDLNQTQYSCDPVLSQFLWLLLESRRSK